MGKRKIFVLVVLGFLIFMVAGEVFLIFNKKQNISIEAPLGPPAELSTNFDPTKNMPRFMIESANAGDKTLNLKFVWPHQLEGKKITSRITCKDGDIKIVNLIDSAGEDVTIDALINKVQETSSELMIFSGLCSDNSCTEINKACQLYVAKN
ncbi:MAG: hypothetical protein ABIL11_00760 [Chloroflexota bacterium]